MTTRQLVDTIMQQAEEKGFGTKLEDINVAEKIALIHSEISEAYEAYRHKNIEGKHGLEEELGDAVQRILHLCGVMNIDIEAAILKKIGFNKKRDWAWAELNESHVQSITGTPNLGIE